MMSDVVCSCLLGVEPRLSAPWAVLAALAPALFLAASVRALHLAWRYPRHPWADMGRLSRYSLFRTPYTPYAHLACTVWSIHLSRHEYTELYWVYRQIMSNQEYIKNSCSLCCLWASWSTTISSSSSPSSSSSNIDKYGSVWALAHPGTG